MEKLYSGRLIRTYKGHYFDVFDPDPNMIEIEDIAHSLSLLCRFAGHITGFYSVAEHSVWVSKRVPEKDRLSALLHDASEAYLIDMPRPIKNEMKEYLQIEDSLMHHIAKKLDFAYPFSPEVKHADKLALEYEWENKVLINNHVSLTHEEAKKSFLEEYYKIKNS